MKLKLDKNLGMPLYLQIKAQLKEKIKNEILLPGEQLPTERELATELGVSRNTVSMAFQELEAEGLLVVEQGKGTFVSKSGGENFSNNPMVSRREKALRLIDQAIDGCFSLGFNVDQLAALAAVRVREREESLKKVRILFVDCHQEQLQNFQRQFREIFHAEIITCSLDDFNQANTNILELLQQIDLVVTTDTHFDEVSDLIEKLGVSLEVTPVCAQPKMESLLRLGRMPLSTKIGLIGLSEAFPGVVHRALRKLGIYELNFDYTNSINLDFLEEFVAAHEVLVVYNERLKEVKMIAGEKELIGYAHELDAGSVTLVRRAIEKAVKVKNRREL